jgi:hypothetical protein
MTNSSSEQAQQAIDMGNFAKARELVNQVQSTDVNNEVEQRVRKTLRVDVVQLIVVLVSLGTFVWTLCRFWVHGYAFVIGFAIVSVLV